MKLLNSNKIDAEYLFLGALFISCLYVWPLGIVYIDKFVLVLLIIFALLKNPTRIFKVKKLRGLFKLKVPQVLLIYFLLCDLITVYIEPSIVTFRWFIVHLITLISFLLYRRINIRYEKLYALLVFYSTISLINYVVFKLIGLQWEEWQGVIVSGSLIASIPFIFAILFICSTISNSKKSREIVLIILVLLNGIVYESRTTILLVFMGLVLILFKLKIEFKNRIRFVFPIFFLAVWLSFFAGTFHSEFQNSTENSKVLTLDKGASYFEDVRDSALLFVLNRNSDSDRFKHVSCALKFIEKREFPELLFGSGANSYKYEIEKCSEFNGNDEIASKIEYVGKGSRSVSITILIVDYGLIGVGLLLLGIILNLRSQLSQRQWYDAAACTLGLYLLFISNVNDVLLVWFLLLFSVGISNIVKKSYVEV